MSGNAPTYHRPAPSIFSKLDQYHCKCMVVQSVKVSAQSDSRGRAQLHQGQGERMSKKGHLAPEMTVNPFSPTIFLFITLLLLVNHLFINNLFKLHQNQAKTYLSFFTKVVNILQYFYDNNKVRNLFDYLFKSRYFYKVLWWFYKCFSDKSCSI